MEATNDRFHDARVARATARTERGFRIDSTARAARLAGVGPDAAAAVAAVRPGYPQHKEGRRPRHPK